MSDKKSRVRNVRNRPSISRKDATIRNVRTGEKPVVEKKETLRINFMGKKNEESPKVAIYRIERGNIRKIDSVNEDKIGLEELERRLEEKGDYGVGPDLPDGEVTKNMLVTFKTDKIKEWSKTGILEINPKWKDWLFPLTCVHGSVKKCSPLVFPLLQVNPNIFKSEIKRFESSRTSLSCSKTSLLPNTPELSIPGPSICAPICNAVVEVYEKTCCCQLRLPEIDYWIDRLKEWILKIPRPIPDPPIVTPIPIPLPDPIPGQDPRPFRQTLKTIKQGLAEDIKKPLGNIPQRLIRDLETMYVLSPMEKLEYVQTHPYIYPTLCSCSSRKVGETHVNESGEFSFCFSKKKQKSGCHVSYYYKVRQWQEDQWSYIYDGTSVNEYFESNEEANLSTWKGLACQPEEEITPDDEFVLLENIGVIPSWKLNSPLQVSEMGVTTANTDDGLVDHNYAGQPWGKALSFRLKFSEGLKSLGAKYYRISVVKANSNGDPEVGQTPQIQTSPLAWRRWINVGGQIKTEAVSLGPNVAGSQSGLYLIPYEADAPLGWLWFQFHQIWNTTTHENGKHLVIIEIFDNGGNRLKPTTSSGTGNPIAFSYRRWVDEENTNTVNYAALTHMFHIDNISCYGDIVDLRKNGIPSTEECQFLTGCANDTFSAGFYAFHKNNFMSSYHLWYHRGLNGPNVTIETDTTNAPANIPPVPSTLDSASAKGSNTKTFNDMLGTHPKCSFSIELRVYPKHTNGLGIIWEYKSSDNAAVALEKVNCINSEVLTNVVSERINAELSEQK